MNKDKKDEQIPNAPNPVQEESWDDFNRLLWKMVNEVDVSNIQAPDAEKADEPNPPVNLRKRDCLSFERCNEIAEKKPILSPVEDSHLKSCQYCQKRIETFTLQFPVASNQSIQEITDTPKQTWLQTIKNAFAANWSAVKFATAAFLLILTVGLLFILFRSNPQPENLANANVQETPSINNIQPPETPVNKPVIITQNPSNVNKTSANLNENKSVATPPEPEKEFDFSAELAYLPKTERNAVLQSLNNGQIIPSQDLALLQENIIRRSKSQIFVPISPKDEAVSSSQPIIRWQNQEKGQYKVEVFDRELKKIAESEVLTQNSWQINKKIPAGFYFWQISKIKSDSTEVDEKSDKVFFKIVSETERNRIERAKNSTKSNLVAAILYARAGLLTEAKRELNLELQKNPNSTKVRKMLSQINGWQTK
jgi:hypothetical protein